MVGRGVGCRECGLSRRQVENAITTMPPEATTKTMGEALCLVPSGPQCARDRGGALDPFDFPPLEEVEPQRKFYSISDRLHVRIDRVDSRNNSSSPQPSIVFKRANLQIVIVIIHLHTHCHFHCINQLFTEIVFSDSDVNLYGLGGGFGTRWNYVRHGASGREQPEV